ncbi:MAG: DUF2807 domain-containing protein [Alphaproteobacteria bacterium]|nr:DUF2807 domain-containing protein [Alphaproteobacteria bacterium]
MLYGWARALVFGGIVLACAAEEAKAEDVTEKTASFAARSLEVRDLGGRLVVEAEDRKDILLVLRGPKAGVEAVRAEARSGTLSLGGGGIDGQTVVRANNVTTVVSGGGSATVSIGGRDSSVGIPSRPPLNVVVRVPWRTPVTIERAVDDVAIGDIDAPLRLGISSASVTVGKVGNTRVQVEGSGDVHLRRVTGDLGIVIGGSGNVKVDDGEIGVLSIAVDGNGDVDVGGRAQTADIALSGAGDVRVREVARKPRVAISGAGDVTVGNWPQ